MLRNLLTCVCLLLGAYALDPTNTFEYEYHVLAKMVEFDLFKAETAMKVAALENQLQLTQKTLRSVSREQSGSTYIRWGKKTCPNITTTSQVYSGQAAGGHYQHTGSAEYICLPIDPEYDTPEVEDKEQQGRSLICGAEYETNSGTLFGKLHDKDVPCSLCYTRGKTTVMLPARTSCYSGWTLEYRGFLMSSEANQPGKNYVCVDKDPEEIDGSNENKNGALLYLVEAREGSFGKKPYKPGWELSCAVCSTTF